MTLSTFGTTLVALIAVACAVLAGTTIWLLLSDPLAVASALRDGTVTPLVDELTRAIVEALRSLLSFL